MIKNVVNLVSWKLLFHSGASSFYSSLLVAYLNHGNVVLVERMVTSWYLTVHIGFIFMALILDVIHLVMGKSSKTARYMAALNNLLFISVVFPFGLFVPLTYWSLFYYNCNLILPNIVEVTLPNWVSTSSHSVISLVVLLEMIATKYTYRGNYILALTSMGVFSVSYIMCLIKTYVKFGFWVYPILHLVPEEELWMVLVAVAAKLVALFFFGAGISFLIHGDDGNYHVLQEPGPSGKPVNSAKTTRGCNLIPAKISKFLNESLFGSRSQTAFLDQNVSRLGNLPSIEEVKNDCRICQDAIPGPKITSFVEESKHMGSISHQAGLRLTAKRLKNYRTPNVFNLTRDNHYEIHVPASSSTPEPLEKPIKTSGPSTKQNGAPRSSHMDGKLVDGDMAMDSLEIPVAAPSPSLATFPLKPEIVENINRKIANWCTIEEQPLVEDAGVKSILKTRVPKTNRNNETVIELKKSKKKLKKEDKRARRGYRDFLKKMYFGEANPNGGWSYLGGKSKREVEKLDTECADFETKSLPADI